MAIGLVNSGIKNENDPVKLLLMDKLESANEYEKIGILMGWSFTYAGTEEPEIIEQIVPLLLDLNNSIELVSIAAMVLGLLCIGTSNNESLEAIITTLMTRDPSDLNSPYARYFALGLGLLFFGKQDTAQASLDAI